MKQTAVEWLKLEIDSIEFQDPAAGQLYLEIQKLFQQAKEMEKEQIINASANAYEDMFGSDGTEYGEKYYKETFKSE